MRGPAGLTGEKAENQLEREENDDSKKYLHIPNPPKPTQRLLIRVAGIREHARDEPKEIQAQDTGVGVLRLPEGECQGSLAGPPTHPAPKQGPEPGGWEPCRLCVCWEGRMEEEGAFANFFASCKIGVNSC